MGCSPRQYSLGENSVPFAYGEGEATRTIRSNL